MAGSLESRGAPGDLIERLKELIEEHMKWADPGIYFFCEGESCVEISISHRRDFSDEVKVKVVGRGFLAAAKLIAELEGLDALKRKYDEVVERFEAGDAGLSDLFNIAYEYNSKARELAEKIHRDSRTIKRKLDLASLGELLARLDAEPSVCDRLIGIINEVVDHPEEG